MKIFISMDLGCVSENKIKEDRMGGAERYCVILKKYLDQEENMNTEMFPQRPNKKYDVCVHSNVFNSQIEADKHILFAGSWHCQGYEHVNLTIMLSQYMKDRLSWDKALVIPAPFDSAILNYKDSQYIPRRICTTSNPNRHLNHTIEVAKRLHHKGEIFDWVLTGGNKLYSDGWGENVSLHNLGYGLIYRGALNRMDLLCLLTGAHVWAYPCFTSGDETQCVSAIEAAALNIPVILPKREPFLEILPEAMFCENVEEMAEKIQWGFQINRKEYKYQDIGRYSSDVIMPEIIKIIKEI